MVADILGEVGRRRDGSDREDVRLVQGIREGVGGPLVVQVLHVQGDLRGTRGAKDRAEQEDEEDREDERKERPDPRAEVLGAEGLHVRQDPANAASTPSCMRAPTRFRKTSSRLARLVYISFRGVSIEASFSSMRRMSLASGTCTTTSTPCSSAVTPRARTALSPSSPAPASTMEWPWPYWAISSAGEPRATIFPWFMIATSSASCSASSK